MTSNLASIRVKSNARWVCCECGSTELVQGHHQVPRDDSTIIPLCAECHSKKHPGVPRGLFFSKNHQPYWENISASSLAKSIGVHPRTIIRRAAKLGVSKGILTADDRKKLCSIVESIWDNRGRREYEYRPNAVIARNIEETRQEVRKTQRQHLYTLEEWEHRHDNLITPYQVMSQLGISRKEVYDLGRSGKLLIVTYIDGYAHFDQQNVDKFQNRVCS